MRAIGDHRGRCQARTIVIMKEKHTCDVKDNYEVYFLRQSIVGSPILEKGVMLGVLS